MPEYSLRERKYAATKAALMDAFIARLRGQGIDEIAVRDVCHEVQVSETTFFNYFPSKNDLMSYSVQLWSIQVGWGMRQFLAQGGSHLDAIRLLFDVTGKREEKSPGGMREIIVLQARQAFVFRPLTPAEYAYHFPDMPEDQRIDAQNIIDLLGEQLFAAQQTGELASGIDVETLTMTLMSIFFMMPIFVTIRPKEGLRAAYRRQLDLLLPR